MQELTKAEARKILAEAQREGRAVRRESFGRVYFEILEKSE